MTIRRNAQGFSLGFGRIAAAATGTLTATLQTPSLLQDLMIETDQEGLVNTLRVSGQNVLASDQGVDINVWDPQSQTEGQRSLGIPLYQNQQVSIEYVLAAAGICQAAIQTDPIGDPQRIVPVNKLGTALDYAFGLGLVAVAAGADGNLSAQARRDVDLGRLILSPSANAIDMTVRSIFVNNIELLSGGATGAARECPLSCFSHLATDYDGATIAYRVGTNDQVQLTLHNYNAAPTTVRGGILCLPSAA